MLDLFIRTLRDTLIAAIKTELIRIDRDVTPNDGLEVFFERTVSHITKEGMIMNGRVEMQHVDKEIWTVDELQTLYSQLKAIDDDSDSITGIGRAVLKQIGLEGRDVVDVIAEPYTDIEEDDEGKPVHIQKFKILLGTSEGKVFEVIVNEVPSEE